jgi:AcrR family transcriptional regulator
VNQDSQVGYATGRATKADIVNAAFHEFAAGGYDGTAVREIARRAGINHATLLHHFPKKHKLLQAVLAHRDDLQHIEPSSLDEMLSLLLGIAIRNEATPGLIRLFTLLAAESTSAAHPAYGYLQRRLVRLREQIAHFVRDGQATGQVASDIDPDATAVRLIALWEGLQLQAPLSDKPLVVSEYLAEAFAVLAGHPVEPAFLP